VAIVALPAGFGCTNTMTRLAGEQAPDRRFFSDVSDDARTDQACLSDQVGRPSQPFHGPAGDRDGRPSASASRAAPSPIPELADDDHSVSSSHDEIPDCETSAFGARREARYADAAEPLNPIEQFIEQFVGILLTRVSSV
jgi:hypothetical protein